MRSSDLEWLLAERLRELERLLRDERSSDLERLLRFERSSDLELSTNSRSAREERDTEGRRVELDKSPDRLAELSHPELVE